MEDPTNRGRLEPTRVPVNRQLAEPESGIVGRLFGQTKALSEDLTSLVELRIKKAQIDIEERVDRKVNQVIANVIFAVLAGLAGLFLLIAASLGIGELLGHPAWGFLIMGLLLGILGIIVKRLHPDMIDIGSKTAVVRENKLAAGAPQGHPYTNSDHK